MTIWNILRPFWYNLCMAFRYSLWSFGTFLRFGMFGPRKIWQPWVIKHLEPEFSRFLSPANFFPPFFPLLRGNYPKFCKKSSLLNSLCCLMWPFWCICCFWLSNHVRFEIGNYLQCKKDIRFRLHTGLLQTRCLHLVSETFCISATFLLQRFIFRFPVKTDSEKSENLQRHEKKFRLVIQTLHRHFVVAFLANSSLRVIRVARWYNFIPKKLEIFC
jgi:hypothetical protein